MTRKVTAEKTKGWTADLCKQKPVSLRCLRSDGVAHYFFLTRRSAKALANKLIKIAELKTKTKN